MTPLAVCAAASPGLGSGQGVPWAGAQIALVCELGGVCFVSYSDYELLSPGLWAWSTLGRNWGWDAAGMGEHHWDVPCAPPWTWPSSRQRKVGGCSSVGALDNFSCLGEKSFGFKYS